MSKSIEACIKGTDARPVIEEMEKKLFHPQTWKPIRIDIMLVRQMFTTSLELKEPNLVVDVSDITFIQNSLIDHLERICIKENGD